MVRLLGRIGDALNKLCQVLMVAAITALIAVMFIQVLRRVFLGSTFSWADGLARYMLVWSAFLGATVAARESDHIALTFIIEKLSGKAKMAFEIFLMLCFAVLAAFVVYAGVRTLVLVAPQKSDSLPISVAWVYGAIPFCQAVILYHLAVNILNRVLSIRGSAKDREAV
ncbi:MAG: TRAP transporter small permease [Gracilibacteraceae bacterium]|jgi:TRAP-type C4-dicarboxylate transport system permease small subunit|nr:TRAP transporter small permease [Gracilibacteraceae bacterium]